MRKDVPVSQFLDSMIARAKADKKTIVLPEGNDIRTLKAAEAILAVAGRAVLLEQRRRIDRLGRFGQRGAAGHDARNRGQRSLVRRRPRSPPAAVQHRRLAEDDAGGEAREAVRGGAPLSGEPGAIARGKRQVSI